MNNRDLLVEIIDALVNLDDALKCVHENDHSREFISSVEEVSLGILVVLDNATKELNEIETKAMRVAQEKSLKI